MKQAPQEYAPGATGQILEMLKGQTVEAITFVKVPDKLAGDFYEYQPIRVVIKDGKVEYFAFVGQSVPHINDAINVTTSWVDEYYYAHD